MLNSVNDTFMATGTAVSHKLLTSEDAGTAMKLPDRAPCSCTSARYDVDSWWVCRPAQKVMSYVHFSVIISDYLHTSALYSDVKRTRSSICTGFLTMWKILITYGLLIGCQLSLETFPVSSFLEIVLKLNSKECFFLTVTINAARGLLSACHEAEIIEVWKHPLNLSLGPSSRQTLSLFVCTYSWCLKVAWNNVQQDSSHCNWSSVSHSQTAGICWNDCGLRNTTECQ